MEQASGIWEIVAKLIITIGGVGGAIYALITYNTKIKKWRKHRSDRRVALDKIIELAMSGGSCMTCNVGELAGLIEKQAENINQLAEAVATVAKQNGYQDAEIARSREQRRVHDIAIFAVVDWIKGNGGNGPINKAHEELFNYLREEAHTPIGGDVDCHAHT